MAKIITKIQNGGYQQTTERKLYGIEIHTVYNSSAAFEFDYFWQYMLLKISLTLLTCC